MKLQISSALRTGDINAYSEAGAERKRKFHAEGRKFMRQLAAELGIADACDIRSNLGGMAVSGEITLHGDHLYVQLSESFNGKGPELLYRSCKGRKDYTGGGNNFISMKLLATSESQQEDFLERCQRLMTAVRAVATPT